MSGMWTKSIAYDSDKYRAWNRERMRRYREGPYWYKEWSARRTKDLGMQREAIETKLAELELVEKELLAAMGGKP